MTTPAPSGRQTLLRHGDQEAVVVEVGGGLRRYRAAGVEVLDGYGEDERCSGGRGQPLLPWPNRLGDGRYRFEGVEEQAPITEVPAGNAIHGLTRWADWSLLDAGTSAATLGHVLRPQPGWAWVLELRLHYELGPDGLSTTVTATNRSGTACPFGAGFHPYLRAPSGRVDDLEVTVPAATRYLTDDRGLPTGTGPVDGTSADLRHGAPVGDRVLDVAYTDLTPDPDGWTTARVADPGSDWICDLRLDPAWSHLMVFTGDTLGARVREGLALEPMTCPADMLASGTGLIRLEPGASWSGTWRLRPGWL